MAYQVLSRRLLTSSALPSSKRITLMTIVPHRPIVTTQNGPSVHLQQQQEQDLYNRDQSYTPNESFSVYHAGLDTHHSHQHSLGKPDIFSPTVNTIFDE